MADLAIAHVTSRGNARQVIFLDDYDYLSFLRMLAELVPGRAWRCHAFCLMPNHIHLLLETPELELAGGMQLLKGRYARRFNARHERVGHVFQARYHAEPVTLDEHLLEASRYIVLNPVRAGLCADAADWPWSSFRTTASLAEGSSWVECETIWELAGGPVGFHRFVAAGAEQAERHQWFTSATRL
jgi:putative transposase